MLKNPRFEKVYRQISKPVFKFIAKRIGATPQAAEEVFEETMIAAWKGFNTFKNKSSYFTWICRIALNKIADYYRGQINERSVYVAPFLEELANIEDNNLNPEEYLALEELRVSIRNCLNILPSEKRNLLYLRYWEKLTIKEIAKRVGSTERKVEGKIYRAKQSLRTIFEDKYPETSRAYIKKTN